MIVVGAPTTLPLRHMADGVSYLIRPVQPDGGERELQLTDRISATRRTPTVA